MSVGESYWVRHEYRDGGGRAGSQVWNVRGADEGNC